MSRVKRFFSVIFIGVLLCACFLFSSCFGDAEMEGTYKFSKMTYVEDGVKVEIKAGEEIMGMVTISEDFMTITLNEDGSAIMKMTDGEETETATGAWEKIDDKTINLIFEGEVQTCKCDGLTITLEEDGAKVELVKFSFQNL